MFRNLFKKKGNRKGRGCKNCRIARMILQGRDSMNTASMTEDQAVTHLKKCGQASKEDKKLANNFSPRRHQWPW